MSDAVDEISLRVPAQLEYGRLVRVGAASVAIRAGLSFPEIDDLRAAIDAAVELLVDAVPAGTQLTAHFRAIGDRLDLEMSGADRTRVPAERLDAFSQTVTDLVDDHDLDGDGRLRLRKTAAPVDE